jgi:uncharacterized protein DUF4440
MKRIFRYSLMFAFALTVSMTAARAQGNKAGLEKTARTFFGFVKANNTDKIKGYYTADYTFTGPDGKMLNAAERLKLLKDGTQPTFEDMSDLTVRTYGTGGMTTGIATTKTSAGETLQSRFIQVWTWRGGRWWLAASQVTPIQ